MSVELDYMEYTSDANAQSAYVSSDTSAVVYTSYSQNLDGSLSIGYDGNVIKRGQVFTLSATSTIASVKVRFGATTGSPTGGCTLDITTTTGSPAVSTGTLAHANLTKSFTPTASTTNTITFNNVATLAAGTYAFIIYSNDTQADGNYWTVVEDNTTVSYTGGHVLYAYPTNWTANTAQDLSIFSVDGVVLQCYSESTIKQQGSYSLKTEAQSGSLNDTLTRTIGSPIDLTNMDTIYFDIRSSRTGSNIKIGIHDSGGTTTEKTHTISAADTWETDTWDISGVANADKDAIDQIIITITNADASNTFYLDNMYAEVTAGGGAMTTKTSYWGDI